MCVVGVCSLLLVVVVAVLLLLSSLLLLLVVVVLVLLLPVFVLLLLLFIQIEYRCAGPSALPQVAVIRIEQERPVTFWFDERARSRNMYIATGRQPLPGVASECCATCFPRTPPAHRALPTCEGVLAAPGLVAPPIRREDICCMLT